MENQQLIDEQFSKLPQGLQEAIRATAWQKTLEEIAQKNKLSKDESEQLETETMLVLYGFENIVKFPDNIAQELNLHAIQAIALAEAINEEIFKPIESRAISERKVNDLTPEIAPQNLPMIEEGEVAHEVPHVEAPAPVAAQAPTTPTPAVPTPAAKPETPAKVQVATPDFRYPTGKDPYREPLA